MACGRFPSIPCAIQARGTHERLEKEITGASGSRLPIERHGPIVSQISIHLVGENHQAVSIRELEKRSPGRRRVRRSGRIVGIDDDKGSRRRRDEAAQMIRDPGTQP